MKAKLTAVCEVWSYDGQDELVLGTSPATDSNEYVTRIVLGEFEVEVPDFTASREQIIAARVSTLENQITEIQANTFKRIAELRDQINQLLCLEDKSE